MLILLDNYLHEIKELHSFLLLVLQFSQITITALVMDSAQPYLLHLSPETPALYPDSIS